MWVWYHVVGLGSGQDAMVFEEVAGVQVSCLVSWRFPIGRVDAGSARVDGSQLPVSVLPFLCDVVT